MLPVGRITFSRKAECMHYYCKHTPCRPVQLLVSLLEGVNNGLWSSLEEGLVEEGVVLASGMP